MTRIYNQVEVSQEVQHALNNNQPVVALESTIISHGMPWPQNAETALLVSKTVRDNGAIPATIAVIDGKLKAGLTVDEIERLAKQGQSVMKCSRRDLPYVVANKTLGATTVAATMLIAEKAGIRIFATGGIGGVHRGATETMDVSADLTELGKTSVAVVCAGAKSILDLALTKEYLETQGVAILGYQTKQLPAFYTQSSSYEVDFCLDSPHEIARFLDCKWSLGLEGGVVIANPIPAEFAMNDAVITKQIEQALKEANALGIKGKDTTPFLLKKITDQTEGESLKANIQLVLNNARLAAKIATEFTKLRR